MSSRLDTFFKKLTEYLTVGKSPLPELFQGGIDRQTVNKLTAGLNLSLPEEVYDLYDWHNGTKVAETYTFDQVWLFPLGKFVPIELSLEAYSEFAGKDDYWLNSMFMLFESGGGEMYLIDCDKNSPTYRQILIHDLGAVDFEVITTIFDSLESLFLSIVECYEKKAYFLDSSGSLNEDPKLSTPIMKKNNPNSKMWE